MWSIGRILDADAKSVQTMINAILLAFVLAQGGLSSPAPPQLQIEAPPELAPVRDRLESLDANRLTDILQLVGLNDSGAPIRVVLATEKSDWAQGVAPWITGFALDNPELVVIFASRSPSYPHDNIDDVLRHEVAHVLIGRAAKGAAIPRWFNEGLAMAAEHGWRLEDQTQLLYHLVVDRQTNLGELDQLFSGNQNNQTRAYALAGAFVRDLLQQYGSGVAAQILIHIGKGMNFESAFTSVIGVSPALAESRFWERQPIWTTWIPLMTSSGTLWIVVTILALIAIYRRHQRSVEIEKQWEDEEESGQGDDLHI